MGNVPLQGAVAKLQFIPRDPIRTEAQLRHREHKQLDAPRICSTRQVVSSKQEYGTQTNGKHIGLLFFNPCDFDIIAYTDSEIEQSLILETDEKED